LSNVDIDSNWDEAIETFDGMELPEELLRGIYAYGFEKPSAIQQRAIRPTILGRDLIAQAQSGTVSSQNIVSSDSATLAGMKITKSHLSSLNWSRPPRCLTLYKLENRPISSRMLV